MPHFTVHKIRISMPMTANVMSVFVTDDRLPGILKKAVQTGAVVETLFTGPYELTGSKDIFEFMETKAYVQPKATRPRKFNWYDVLPPAVAKRQIMWERNNMAHRMWKLNISKKEIARRLGVTSARVNQVVLEHQQRYDIVEGREPQPNPAQKYFNGSYRNDLKRLERGYEPWEYI